MPFYALLLPILIVLALSAACSTSGNSCQSSLLPEAVAGGHTVEHTIHSNGKARHYLLHFPILYEANKPAPLIFSFHGNSHDAYYQESLSQFSNASFNANSIAVYPQGLNVSLYTGGEIEASANKKLEFLGVSALCCPEF